MLQMIPGAQHADGRVPGEADGQGQPQPAHGHGVHVGLRRRRRPGAGAHVRHDPRGGGGDGRVCVPGRPREGAARVAERAAAPAAAAPAPRQDHGLQRQASPALETRPQGTVYSTTLA